MVFIFSLSSQAGDESNQMTSGISMKIENSIKVVVPEVSLDTISLNNIVRKNSHFLIYLFLGMLLSFTMGGSGVHKKRSRVIALLICVLFAASDEIHQIFVPGRGPGILDVGIDCVGAITGIMIYAVVAKLLQKYSLFRKLFVDKGTVEEKTSVSDRTS
jgi:VanZ family protein